jgi:bile acid-coenzyme A ligase
MMLRDFNSCFDAEVADGPTRPALSVGPVCVTYGELRDRALRAAHQLACEGVEPGEIVGVQLGNSLDAVTAFLALWRIGAVPLPLPDGAPAPELDAIRTVAGTTRTLDQPFELDDEPPLGAAPVLSPSLKALATGGSTGVPKVILDPRPPVIDLDRDHFGHGLVDTMVLAGPLFHSGPFHHTYQGLARGRHVVLMRRFDAEEWLGLVDHHRAGFMLLVPTMMHRIMRLSADARARCDTSNVRRVWHTGAVCPPALKQQWIDWLGPETIFEIFGGSEGVATTEISGTEWLEHRGSVGRATGGEIAIFDDDGNRLPPGVVGEIYMRRAPGVTETIYAGNPGGRRFLHEWESFGDLGHLDPDGYLYLADRRRDLIVTGGENVYPAEVEAALESHHAVVDCAVLGVPDDDLGEQVAAVVCVDADVTPDALARHVSTRLVRHKVPRRIVLTDHPVRNDAGKVRRSLLRTLFA